MTQRTGASPGFGRGGGGARIFFFRFGNLHVAEMRFARGIRGHDPPRNFFKMVQFGAFGVYFDHILSLKYFKNYHFLYKIINILDTRLLWGNYSREEIF